jgi:hypothetical protein
MRDDLRALAGPEIDERLAGLDSWEANEEQILRADPDTVAEVEDWQRQGPVHEALSPSRIDLVERIREGVPAPEYVPGGDGWLRRAKRYLFFAPAGNVKTLGTLVVCVGVVEAGGLVAILDLENGADEYARRLEHIIGEDEDRRAACAARLRYFEYPGLALGWREDDLVGAFAGDDLVVFDSSRVALSSVGLSEDANDDYSRFVRRLLEPLSRAGTTTIVLDNSGHEGGHPRGASAKSDLNEVVFEFRVTRSCDVDETGEVIWQRRRSRFSGIPASMSQRLGGGVYEMPRPVERTDEVDPFRPTFLMERASRYIEDHRGCSQRDVRDAGLGKTKYVVRAVGCLLDEGYVVNEGTKSTHAYRSQIRFRLDDDDALATAEEEAAAADFLDFEGDE